MPAKILRFLVISFVVCLCVVTSNNVSLGETVLFDDFEDGQLDGWFQWRGSASAVDGDMQITVDSGGSGVMRIVGLNLEDTSLRARGRLLEPDSSLTLVARHRPENQVNGIGSYLGSILPDGTVSVGVGGAAFQIIEELETDLAPLEEDVLLQLDVIGNTVSFWAWRPGEIMPLRPLVSTVDLNNSQPFGDIAIATFSDSTARPTSGLYRYVHVADAHLGSCDVDTDGLCDIGDLNALLQRGPVASGVAVTPGVNEQFDLNGDGVIDNADVDQWLADAATLNGYGSPYKRGDANLDGEVDVGDFNDWNANKFTATLLWNDGNFNGDANTDVGDFNLWNQFKFTSSGGPLVIPEPTAALLMVIQFAAAAVLLRRTT